MNQEALRVIEECDIVLFIVDISQPPNVYYQRVYLDMVSPSAMAMRFAYDFAGPDRLIFGSDHPWVKIDVFLELIEEMEIPQEDKDKILGLNAQKLFGSGMMGL